MACTTNNSHGETDSPTEDKTSSIEKLNKKVLEHSTEALDQQVSSFIQTKFAGNYREESREIYHPVASRGPNNSETWSEGQAEIDTNVYVVNLRMVNEVDTINWKLVFNKDYELILDVER